MTEPDAKTVERVAMAICYQYNISLGLRHHRAVELAGFNWISWKSEAKAAIQAVQEAT